MKMDSIKKYISLRESLVREKQELEARLREINGALGSVSAATPAALAPVAAAGRRGRRGPISLRTVKMGYKFQTTNPMNSLGVILYGKANKFKRNNGVFSYSGPVPAAESASGPAPSKAAKRKISPEGLARIAAAQRARWAKAKAGR
jgi:hypothetical protein